jgi:hypothetical protein
MGDKSPKAIHKTAKQHQVKANEIAQKKQAAEFAKRSASKKS